MSTARKLFNLEEQVGICFNLLDSLILVLPYSYTYRTDPCSYIYR